MLNLEQRIAAALADEATASTAISELLQETDAAIIAADATAEEERAKAMDPALSPDPKAARAAMEYATFAADRLRTLQPRLQNYHERVARAERKTAWIKQYDTIKPEHDALVAELKDTYGELETKMVDLLSRLRAFDARARALMQTKPFPESGEPDDGRRLLPVECAARGVSGFGPQDLSLDRNLVLPDFNKRGARAWPPFELPLGALLAQDWRWS